MKRIIYLIIVLTLAPGCTLKNEKPGKERIVVSIVPLKYLTDKVSGGDFDVMVMVPPGSSPETYEPLPSQMKEATDSKAYFHLGLIDFENSLQERIAGTHSIRTVNLSDNLDIIYGSHHHKGGGARAGADPHVWMSPSRMREMAGEIASALSEIQPDSSFKYTSNLASLSSVIDSLDSYIAGSMSDLQMRVFVTNHPFLTYYADDYGLEQLSLEHEGKEPLPGYFKSIYGNIKTKGITTIFYQREAGDNGVRAMAQEAGLKRREVDPLEYDWMANMYKITDMLTESMQ